MKFVFAYHGGSMPETEEGMQQALAAWESWIGAHGSAFLDPGNPTGPSTTVGADGVTEGGGANPLTGYSLVDADDLAAATAIAKDCPILFGGGTVEVAQAIDLQ